MEITSSGWPFTLSVSVTGLGFIVYFFAAQSEKMRRHFENRLEKEEAQAMFVYYQRWCGVLFLGVLPMLITWLAFRQPGADYGLSGRNAGISLAWIGGLGLLVTGINYLNARSPENLAMYPQIRMITWDRRVFLCNAFTWMAYLFAYELLFRGLFFFPCLRFMGLVPAIALNAVIYALVHIPKGIKETLGAIPLGIVLCWLTAQTGNIWIAFGVHVVMALTNDTFSLFFHPSIDLRWQMDKK